MWAQAEVEGRMGPLDGVRISTSRLGAAQPLGSHAWAPFSALNGQDSGRANSWSAGDGWMGMFRRRKPPAARMRGTKRDTCPHKTGLGSPPRAVPWLFPDPTGSLGGLLAGVVKPSRAAVCRQDLRCPLRVRVGSPLGVDFAS